MAHGPLLPGRLRIGRFSRAAADGAGGRTVGRTPYRPPGFECRAVTVEPGGDRIYHDAEWQDALVLIARGEIELEWRDGQDVWLAYFGIMPEFRGRGLGKWLLSEALATAWLREPERVRVETCTLDDPRALPLYQRMGFVPYERRQKVIEA